MILYNNSGAKIKSCRHNYEEINFVLTQKRIPSYRIRTWWINWNAGIPKHYRCHFCLIFHVAMTVVVCYSGRCGGDGGSEEGPRVPLPPSSVRRAADQTDDPEELRPDVQTRPQWQHSSRRTRRNLSLPHPWYGFSSASNAFTCLLIYSMCCFSWKYKHTRE